MENLEIYNQVRNVPAEAQKSFNNGRFSGTDINPMWRIKKMTEVFGMCGIGWYYKVINREIIQDCAFVSIELFVKQDGEWSQAIYGEGGNKFIQGNKTSDEAYKMALTDAVSNATKQLGLGADIWFQQDVTKYTQQQPAQQPVKVDKAAGINNIKKLIDQKTTAEELNKLKEEVNKKADYKEEMALGGVLYQAFYDKALTFNI